tara:strand:- start:2064 stop:2453 length:390 start_codon:yes stop_codon:yes gene_type:complete
MIPKYKDIIDLVKKGSTIEAQEKIMQLREAAMELKEENVSLRKKKELEDLLAIKKNLSYEKPYYWIINEEKKEGPFCQLCYDKEQLLVRLQDRNKGKWACHSCKTIFYDSNYVPPTPMPRTRSRRAEYF